MRKDLNVGYYIGLDAEKSKLKNVGDMFYAEDTDGDDRAARGRSALTSHEPRPTWARRGGPARSARRAPLG